MVLGDKVTLSGMLRVYKTRFAVVFLSFEANSMLSQFEN